jgi:hypothetical protein
LFQSGGKKTRQSGAEEGGLRHQLGNILPSAQTRYSDDASPTAKPRSARQSPRHSRGCRNSFVTSTLSTSQRCHSTKVDRRAKVQLRRRYQALGRSSGSSKGGPTARRRNKLDYEQFMILGLAHLLPRLRRSSSTHFPPAFSFPRVADTVGDRASTGLSVSCAHVTKKTQPAPGPRRCGPVAISPSDVSAKRVHAGKSGEYPVRINVDGTTSNK